MLVQLTDYPTMFKYLIFKVLLCSPSALASSFAYALGSYWCAKDISGGEAWLGLPLQPMSSRTKVQDWTGWCFYPAVLIPPVSEVGLRPTSSIGANKSIRKSEEFLWLLAYHTFGYGDRPAFTCESWVEPLGSLFSLWFPVRYSLEKRYLTLSSHLLSELFLW